MAKKMAQNFSLRKFSIYQLNEPEHKIIVKDVRRNSAPAIVRSTIRARLSEVENRFDLGEISRNV